MPWPKKNWIRLRRKKQPCALHQRPRTKRPVNLTLSKKTAPRMEPDPDQLLYIKMVSDKLTEHGYTWAGLRLWKPIRTAAPGRRSSGSGLRIRLRPQPARSLKDRQNYILMALASSSPSSRRLRGQGYLVPQTDHRCASAAPTAILLSSITGKEEASWENSATAGGHPRRHWDSSLLAVSMIGGLYIAICWATSSFFMDLILPRRQTDLHPAALIGRHRLRRFPSWGSPSPRRRIFKVFAKDFLNIPIKMGTILLPWPSLP